MNQEIGSEFWDIPLEAEPNKLFPRETAWFLSGRWALDFILADIQADEESKRFTAAIPSWCCHTIIEPFLKRNFAIRFYSVLPEDNGGIRIDTSGVIDCDVLLVIDYFGYYTETTLLSGFDGIVIRDTTHSLFAALPRDEDYIFGSLRKWAGFWTGGYAWKWKGRFHFALPQETDFYYVKNRQRAMSEKLAYLKGQRRSKDYLDIFSEAEALLEKNPAALGAEKRDVDAAKHLDVTFLSQRRRENAAILLKGISSIALFPQLADGVCPLFVPILVPERMRDALSHYLIQHGIYCPIHWPVSSLHRLKKPERKIYDEELSLVCDQRYGPADMERILRTVQEFFEREA